MPKIKIEEAQKAADEFLKKTLKVKETKVIKAVKAGNGWEVEAEVYEESSLMKALGLPVKVQDRNIYTVKLNDGMEIESYARAQTISATED
ncbi:MAG: gas vesicle protein [Elusimicrobia bacterium]|nr:gas vesicle protein [Elusimicrobiota bacterium]